MNRARHFALVLLSSSFLGCQPASAPSPGELTAASVEDHHGIPAHKPASFAGALEELTRRLNDLEARAAPSMDSESFRQLLDIVRWLPELAADTDLARPKWERVQRLSRDMEHELSAPQPDMIRCRQQLQELGDYAEQVIVASKKEAR